MTVSDGDLEVKLEGAASDESGSLEDAQALLPHSFQVSEIRSDSVLVLSEPDVITSDGDTEGPDVPSGKSDSLQAGGVMVPSSNVGVSSNGSLQEGGVTVSSLNVEVSSPGSLSEVEGSLPVTDVGGGTLELGSSDISVDDFPLPTLEHPLDSSNGRHLPPISSTYLKASLCSPPVMSIVDSKLSPPGMVVSTE